MTRHLLLLLGLVAVSFAVACGGDDDDVNSGEQPVKAAELQKVTVGYIPILIYAPFFVSIERGYFAEEGIEVNLQRLAGGADMLVQTAAGNFDVGAGGIGAAVFNAAGAAIREGKEVPFEVVAPLHSEKPPVTTPLVVSKARFDAGEMKTVADLRGKKVAINARGAATEYWLERALASGGLSIKDITLVTVPFNDVPAALQNRSIDGSMLGEPITTQAEDQGLVKVLTEDFVDGDQPTAVYWNRSWAAGNKKLAAGFLRAYLKGVAELEAGGWQNDEVLAILQKYTSIPAEVIKRASRPYNDPEGKLNFASFRKQEAFFREQGLLTYEGTLDFSAFMRGAK